MKPLFLQSTVISSLLETRIFLSTPADDTPILSSSRQMCILKSFQITPKPKRQKNPLQISPSYTVIPRLMSDPANEFFT